MKKLMMISFLIAAAAAGCGKKEDPNAQCEKIYQKGDGTNPYSTDKAAFIAACTKVSAQTRTCLLDKNMLDNKDCQPGKGPAFRESMQLMELGQGKK